MRRIVNLSELEPKPGFVVLDGALGIRSIAAVHATLLDTLARHSSVQIDCSAAETIDLSFIQLLLAARRSAGLAGKSLVLTVPASGALRAALEQGGLWHASGADPFWSGDA